MRAKLVIGLILALRCSAGTLTRDCWLTAVSLKPELLPKLAEVLGVSVDHLLGAQRSPRSNNGPIGKLRKVFEAASALPRYQQQRVIAIVEDILISYHTKASQDRD